MPIKACFNDTGSRAYCGPVVIGAVTGKPISKVRDAIRASRKERGHNIHDAVYRLRPITVTCNRDLGGALNKLGYWMSLHDGYRGPTKSRPTLAAWLRKRTPEDRKATFIIAIGVSGDSGGHWVAVSGKKFVDTFTKGLPVWISDAPHRRARVATVYKVHKHK